MTWVPIPVLLFTTFTFAKPSILPHGRFAFASKSLVSSPSIISGSSSSLCATPDTENLDCDEEDFEDFDKLTNARADFLQTEFRMEIKVLLDDPMVAAVKKSKKELNEYIKLFFNGVNHIYKMGHKAVPSFPNLNIVVVSYEQLDGALEKKIFKPATQSTDEDEIIDIENVLDRLKRFGGKFGKYDEYDHVMLLTGRDLYRMENDNYNSDVLGVAFINATCSKSSNDYEALSIVEDGNAVFFGVYPAAHEIAHNLAAKHDPSKTSSTTCHSSKGYIMTPTSTSKTDNMYQFSKCSLKAMTKFFLSGSSSCLRSHDHEPLFPVDPKLPGEWYTMQQICDKLAADQFPNELELTVKVNPVKDGNALCKQISCKVIIMKTKKVYLNPPYAPAENTVCEGGRCKSGKCE